MCIVFIKHYLVITQLLTLQSVLKWDQNGEYQTGNNINEQKNCTQLLDTLFNNKVATRLHSQYRAVTNIGMDMKIDRNKMRLQTE